MKIFLLLIILTFNTALNAATQALDVAIIIDTSGSMKKNDPHKLRTDAAKMFIALLDRTDRVSIVSFSNRAYPVTRFLSLNERKNEQKLLSSIDNLISNGKHTNLHDALLRGYELLKSNSKKSHEKHIILMSDGKMDSGNNERNLKLLEKTLDTLTPKLAKADIKVHTIAFTKQSYIPLLKLTAKDTKGQFIILKNANSVHQVFENLFERAKTPEMVPLKEDSFILDKGVKELTIVASKYKPYSAISLASPTGEDFDKTTKSNKVKWFSSKQFDLITVTNPPKGYWLVKYSEGGNKAYIVPDLSLEASTTKRYAEPESPLQIQAYLSRNNKKMNRNSLLRSTEFMVKVTSPVGVTIENRMVDDGSEIGSERNDGIYGVSYSFDLEGTYKVDVTATGQTFDRKRTLFIDVMSQNTNRPFADAKSKRDLQAEIRRLKEAEAARIIHEAEEKARVEAEALAAAERKAAEELMKKTQPEHGEGHEIEADHHEEEPAVENEAHEEEGGKFKIQEALIAFLMFNVFLASVGGGYYYYYQRQKKQKSKDIVEEEETKPEPKASANAVDLSTEDDGHSEFGEMDDDHEDIDLDSEESISSAVTDIDLEEELSSILETEMEK